MQEFTPSLFSTRVHNGRRTYFFDVKSAKNSKPFLKITQAEINGDEKKKTYLNIFDSEVHEFSHAIEEVMGFLKQQTK